ncbi:hypothetical protein J4G43_047335 [Bradyrhizobium barranii subsp. barranii]|uniref:Uncharacterized protein n=1 Tax=Bradyrhizobium barranii subsp. barranii TaxID=2823807 RepID=A0A939MG07_9BRAD|nr:hypothetical protein [Bradyrhizobium barranii]UEM11982.1 hypothetical protein J4G43_047335 [Bradyrhizobium barranii subsp. barranii]
MAEYQLTTPDTNGPVLRIADSAFIPADPANRDWIEYQDWLAAGGVPDPYVPPPVPEPPPPTMVAWSDQYEAVSGAVSGISSRGQLGWDDADHAAATTVYMAKKNAADSDIGTAFAVALQPGRVLRIEARNDSTSFVSHNIVATEKRGSDFAITVTPRDNSARAAPVTQTVSIAVFDVPPGATKSIV